MSFEHPASREIAKEVVLPTILNLDEYPVSLVGKIEGLTPEMEEKFRKGYVYFDSIDGIDAGVIGDIETFKEGTSEYDEALKDMKIFDEWEDKRAFQSLTEEERVNEYNLLTEELKKWGINVDISEDAFHGEELQVVRTVFSSLPEAFYEKTQLKNIDFGGGQPMYAEIGFSYQVDEGKISLPKDWILEYSRLTLAMFVHELGHSIESRLLEESAAVKQAYETIQNQDLIMGVDFTSVYNKKTRINYQKDAIREFIAETFMLYMLRGDMMREAIRDLDEGDGKQAWETVYNAYRNLLDGYEFSVSE